MNLISWHQEDGEWFGWDKNHDPREDEPQFMVKEVEDGVWAGFVYEEDRTRQCITSDWTNSYDAKCDLEGMMFP